METNEITERIIGAAIRVHRNVGPGLLESTYEECLAMELGKRRLRFERQVALPIRYEGRVLRFAYRADMIVEDRVVVELETVARIERVHLSQLLTYLKHSGCPVGLLFNFDVNVLTQEGLRRVVNSFDEPSVCSPPPRPLRCELPGRNDGPSEEVERGTRSETDSEPDP